jgi:hypothetical protein
MAVDQWVVPTPIFQYLATTGKGATTGHTNAIGDYSTGTGTSGESFIIAPTTAQVFRIERMIAHIRDTGAFASSEYGSTAALTNGITVKVVTSTGTVHDLTNGVPVMTNADWSRQCYDTTVFEWGVANEHLSARWTFAKAGYPLRLDGAAGQRLEVHLQDSCTDLTEHRFYVNGYVEDAAYKLDREGH